MEPEERIILSDILCLDRATDAEGEAAVDAFLRTYPNAEAVVARLAARLGEPGLFPPDTARTFEVIWRRVQQHGVSVAATQQTDATLGTRTPRFSARFAEETRGQWGLQALRRGAWPTVVALVVGVVVTVVAWNAGMRHLSQHEAASTLTYTTANGQRANITLPDGSTVALNVDSRLDVPADYVTGHHTVRLVGEALFTVSRHEGTLFTVIAGPTTTRVLGTSFVVRHYPTDTTTTVAVRDGKVSVRSLVLTAAQQVEISQTGVTRIDLADASQFSFATGVLTFDGVPLRDAIVMLDRWFNADIRLGDPALGTRQVTGGFTAGSLSDLTESLELTFNMRVVRDERVLTVYPR
jgi:ferric-dicitrate binding protein FerR (iron transport regulator)